MFRHQLHEGLPSSRRLPHIVTLHQGNSSLAECITENPCCFHQYRWPRLQPFLCPTVVACGRRTQAAHDPRPAPVGHMRRGRSPHRATQSTAGLQIPGDTCGRRIRRGRRSEPNADSGALPRCPDRGAALVRTDLSPSSGRDHTKPSSVSDGTREVESHESLAEEIELPLEQARKLVTCSSKENLPGVRQCDLSKVIQK
jgi:hypothetical protein